MEAGDSPGCLVTRPEPGAAETAALVAALGWRPVLAPALLLEPCRAPLPPARAREVATLIDQALA